MEQKKDNRKRIKLLQVRLNQKEDEALTKLCESSWMKRSTMIRQLILEQDANPTPQTTLSPEDREAIEQLSKELNRIGTNINQIAKRINRVNLEGDSVPAYYLDLLEDMELKLEGIYQKVDNLNN